MNQVDAIRDARDQMTQAVRDVLPEGNATWFSENLNLDEMWKGMKTGHLVELARKIGVQRTARFVRHMERRSGR